jgi:thiol:disulfide interchange protein
VTKYRNKVRILTGNTDEDRELLAQTKPTAYPTYLVYNQKGKEVARVIGNDQAAIQRAIAKAQNT